MVRADLIIAGSNFIFSHICENYENYISYPKRKLLVIFRGINTEYFSQKNTSNKKMQKQLEDWDINKDKFIILLPGRLTNWKGQTVFIEALNILNQQPELKQFVAIILGSDQGRNVYYKKLLSLVEKYRLNQKIKFISFCKEMPLAYKLADVVVSSSIEPEAFGRVSVEAQSMEKPIIASDIGGSKETILNDKTGLLFKPGDPIALAEKLKEILNYDSNTIQMMGIEGRKNILKKFDVEKMCNSTITEYKKIINI
jgi:glycosyltransferase involved in cell wall biosynthesis